MSRCAVATDDTTAPAPEERPEYRQLAEHATNRMASFGMPPGVRWAFIFTPDPIDARQPITPTALVAGSPAHIEALGIPTRGGGAQDLAEIDGYAGQDIAGLDGYKIEFFGRLLNSLPANGGPAWTLVLDDGSPQIVVELWQMRALIPGASCFAESTWNPVNGQHHSIHFTGDAWPDTDVIAAKRGLEWPREFKKMSRRGKNVGDGATWPGGIEEFLDDLWTTLEKRQKSTGKPWGHDPTTRPFRLDMRNLAAPRTVSGWLAKAGLRPQDIKSGAVTRSNYSQFVVKRRP